MACDNCKDLTAFWCPVCSDTPPAKHAVCEVCHDATCPCGKVVMRTDAELIDALRACREKLALTIEVDQQRLADAGMRVGLCYGCDTPDAMADEIEALRIELFDALCIVHSVTKFSGEDDERERMAARIKELFATLPATPEASNG